MDILAAIADTKGKNLSVVLDEYADYSRTGVIGHSMGGNAAVKIATWKNATEDFGVLATVGLMPAVKYDPGNKPEQIRVPVFFEAGSADLICPDSSIKEAYVKDQHPDKVFAD